MQQGVRIRTPMNQTLPPSKPRQREASARRCACALRGFAKCLTRSGGLGFHRVVSWLLANVETLKAVFGLIIGLAWPACCGVGHLAVSQRICAPYRPRFEIEAIWCGCGV